MTPLPAVGEEPVHDERARPLGRAHAHPVFAARLRVRSEDPAAALVGQAGRERGRHKLRGARGFAGRNAPALEFPEERGNELFYPPLVPAAQLVVRDSLQPAMHDRPDMPRGLAHPRELDLRLVLAPGFRGDVVACAVEDWREIAYWLGDNRVSAVWTGGSACPPPPALLSLGTHVQG